MASTEESLRFLMTALGIREEQLNAPGVHEKMRNLTDQLEVDRAARRGNLSELKRLTPVSAPTVLGPTTGAIITMRPLRGPITRKPTKGGSTGGAGSGSK